MNGVNECRRENMENINWNRICVHFCVCITWNFGIGSEIWIYKAFLHQHLVYFCSFQLGVFSARVNQFFDDLVPPTKIWHFQSEGKKTFSWCVRRHFLHCYKSYYKSSFFYWVFCIFGCMECRSVKTEMPASIEEEIERLFRLNLRMVLAECCVCVCLCANAIRNEKHPYIHSSPIRSIWIMKKSNSLNALNRVLCGTWRTH